MKGWYVIPSNDEPVEVKTKQKALSLGKKLYKQGDEEVFIQQFDDENSDGYFAGQKTIYIKDLFN